jgi:hypothetical protein
MAGNDLGAAKDLGLDVHDEPHRVTSPCAVEIAMQTRC